MKINYLLGRAGTGKTHFIYEKIKESLINGEEKNILIVPEQYTLQGEIDLISKMKLEGLLNVQVLSFKRLAFRVMSEVGGIKKNLITDLGKIMTLRNIFEENKGELNIFVKSYSQEGFLSEFKNLISEFRKNNITYEELKNQSERIENDFILKNKLKDISLIYKLFSENLEGKYIDEEETLNILAENISCSNALEGCNLWLDGFNSFSGQEYKILEELFKKAKETTISLTLDDNNHRKDYDLFYPTISTYNKLQELSERNNIAKNVILLTDSFEKSSELIHLEKNIYSYPAEIYRKEVKNIKLTSALNIYNETESAAIEIINLVRDKGYKWQDIAVVTNALDVYASVIRKVFQEYDIPVFVDEKKSINGNPLVNFIKSALRIINDDFKWEDVFIFLKTGFTDLNNEESQELQNYILEKGIKGRLWRNGFDNPILDEYRKKIIENFIVFKKDLKNYDSGKSFSLAVFNFLQIFKVYEKLEDILSREKEKGNYEFVNENSQIWNIVMEVLEQIADITGDEKYSLKDMYKILESGFNSYELGVIPPTMDQVLAGNLERSKSHDIKALFLLGCNDGIIPRSYAEGGILLDQEKIKLQNLGLGLYKDNETEMKEEKFLVYSVFSKPSEKLFISWSLGDLDGKALRPSILVERLKNIFPLEIEADIYFSQDPFIKSTTLPLPALKYLSENFRKNIDYGKMDSRWWDVYSWYYENSLWEDKLSLIIKGLFHENQEKESTNSKRKDVYLSKDRFSISRLETYSNCPFKHFVKYGLRPVETKEYKVQLPDIGTLFHAALEVFPGHLKKENINWKEISKEDTGVYVDEIVDTLAEKFQNGLLESSARNIYLKEKIKRVTKRAVKTLTEQLQKGSFEPWKFEHPFRTLISPEKGIVLEGRVDRLDLWQDNEENYYLRVIDYKSGQKKFDLNDVLNLIQLQLVVYLLASLDEAKKEIGKDIKSGGAFYFRIDDPVIETEESQEENINLLITSELKMDGFLPEDKQIVRAMDNSLEDGSKSTVIPVGLKNDGDFNAYSKVFTENQLEKIFEYVKIMTIDIVEKINSGDIKIQPGKGKNYSSCSFCEYHSLCQFDTAFPENYYRKLVKYNKDEIIKVMSEKRCSHE